MTGELGVRDKRKTIVLAVAALLTLGLIALVVLFFTGDEAGSLTTSNTAAVSRRTPVHRPVEVKPSAAAPTTSEEEGTARRGH